MKRQCYQRTEVSRDRKYLNLPKKVKKKNLKDRKVKKGRGTGKPPKLQMKKAKKPGKT